MDPRDVVTVPDRAGGDDDAPTRLGHFTLGRRLGEGGMGVVFEARDDLLARRVAVKVLHPGSSAGTEGRSNLLREAQALARLSHPNVVPVYEVGVVEQDIFVAMELVDGLTLSQWLKTPRDWRAVLDVFLAAGRGLAAVHALDLVHRDFKPSNVLISLSGTPKVGDFGLVCHSGEGGDGVVCGTPTYMPPEQREGDAVDARADQFAFATALSNALGTRAPARVKPILARARAEAAADRYPSMNALLGELARVRRGRAAWWIAGGALAVAIACVLIAWRVGRSQVVSTSDDPCPPPDAELAPIWGDARQADLRAHLAAIDPAQGAARFDAVARALGGFTDAWRTMHVDACRATRVDGSQSDTLLDRRMSCLDRTLDELGDTVDAIATASDARGLDAAMHAVTDLPALDACADATALTERVPPPTEPGARAEYDALERELTAIDVTLQIDTRFAGLEPRLAAAIARARLLGHPYLLGEALLAAARFQTVKELSDAALVLFREAVETGARAKDDQLVAEAWVKEIGVINDLQHRPEDAQKLVQAADAAVTRAGDPPEQRFDLLFLQVRIAAVGLDAPTARSLLAQANAVLAGATGDESYRRLEALGAAAMIEGFDKQWTAAVDAYHRYIDAIRAAFGSDHGDLMDADFNLAIVLHYLGKDDDALVAFRDAARIGEARLPPSPNLAGQLLAVGTMLGILQRNDESLPYLQRALAMAKSVMPDDDPRLANAYDALGTTLTNLGRYDEAGPDLVEAAARYQRIGTPSDQWANALLNLGLNAVDAGDCATAAAPLARAVAMFEQLHGADHAESEKPRFFLAECASEAHHWSEVLDDSQRVLAITGDSDDAFWHVEAHYLHGRALAESHRDAAGGVREVKTARAAMAAANVDASVIADADHWLAAHR